MTDLRQAAQQALECIERLNMHGWILADFEDEVYAAITALRTALAQEHAMHDLARLGQEIEQEPSQWRDMVVVSLVREGINKHRARELADHFATQRPWQGLTDEELQFYIKKHSKLVNAGYDKATDTNLVAKTFDSTGFYKEVSAVLKERNT
jgi:hypothetical protein